MPTYCYIDDEGYTFESVCHGLGYQRNYRAEQVGTSLHALRDSVRASEEHKLFLPNRQELEQKMSPRKADAFIKDWNNRHESRHSAGDKYRPR